MNDQLGVEIIITLLSNSVSWLTNLFYLTLSFIISCDKTYFLGWSTVLVLVFKI